MLSWGLLMPLLHVGHWLPSGPSATDSSYLHSSCTLFRLAFSKYLGSSNWTSFRGFVMFPGSSSDCWAQQSDFFHLDLIAFLSILFTSQVITLLVFLVKVFYFPWARLSRFAAGTFLLVCDFPDFLTVPWTCLCSCCALCLECSHLCLPFSDPLSNAFPPWGLLWLLQPRGSSPFLRKIKAFIFYAVTLGSWSKLLCIVFLCVCVCVCNPLFLLGVVTMSYILYSHRHR